MTDFDSRLLEERPEELPERALEGEHEEERRSLEARLLEVKAERASKQSEPGVEGAGDREPTSV